MRLPSRPGVRPSGLHVLGDTARFAQREVEAAAGRFTPAAHAAFGDRLARDARERIERSGIERLIRVHDPRHLAFAGAVVGRRHVDARSDEVLLDQLVRVAARDALELLDRVFLRIDLHRALGAAVRQIDDRALVGHQRGEPLDLFLVDERRVANAALGRQLVMAVLDAPRVDALERAVRTAERETRCDKCCCTS